MEWQAQLGFGSHDVMTTPYAVLDRKTEGGKEIYLYVGGDNDGWWLDNSHNPVRRADPGEVDAAKRKYWNLPADGTS